MTPRCGRVMLRFEAVWGALLDEVTCGRPEGHSGQHRSVLAVAAAVERDRKAWPGKRERRRQAQRRAVLAEAATDGYRAGPKGLERVCGLDEQPEGDVTELVRVELDPAAAVEEPLW